MTLGVGRGRIGRLCVARATDQRGISHIGARRHTLPPSLKATCAAPTARAETVSWITRTYAAV